MNKKRVCLRIAACITGCFSVILNAILLFGLYRNFGHLAAQMNNISGLTAMVVTSYAFTVGLWELQKKR